MSFRFLRLRGKHAKQPVGIFVTFSVLVSSLFVSPLLIPDQGAQASGVEIDKALDLDGAVLATPDIDNDTFITNGADNFTVSLWAKIDSGASLSGEEYLFQISRGTDALVFLDDGELRMKPYGQADIGSGFTPAAGAWHHYAFVFDTTSSGSQHTLYVDGQQVITDSHGTLGVRYIHFGGSSSGSLNFPGEIDEIKVWNKKSLTPSEIQNTMHSFGDGSGTGSAGLDDTNLYIYENFNDSSLNSEKGVNLSVSAGTIGGYVDVATTSETGSDTIITFPRSYITSDGGWTVPEGVSSARALSVGGGGAGGWGNGNEGGGGGGAGRLLHDTSVDLSASVHSVKVGQGGVGSTTTSTPGANGQESLAFGLRALGGGGGGSCSSSKGSDGGSGGGGSGCSSGKPGGFDVSTYGGLGNDGGSGTHIDSDQKGNAGGGGGAGGAGGNGSARSVGTSGGAGSGSSNDITGSSITYAQGGNGAAGNSVPVNPALTTASRGFGGAGVNNVSDRSSAGGSGVVILRYTTPVVPGTVQNFSAETRLVDDGTDTDSVTLNWDELTGQSPAVTGYLIEYNKDNDFTTANSFTSVSEGGTTTKTITGLDDGDTYYFRIKAINGFDDDRDSGQVIESRAVSKADSSLNFDGSFTVTGNPSSAVIPTSKTASFTVESWVRAGSLASGENIIINQRTADETYDRFFVALRGGSPSRLEISRPNLGLTNQTQRIDIPEPSG